MTTLYIANDGTQFYNEAECVQHEYETDLRRGKDIIIGRTLNGSLIDYEDPDFFGKAFFITCKNDEAITCLNKRRQTMRLGPCNEINKPGVYYWDSAYVKWILVQSYLDRLEEKISLLKMVLEDGN